MEDKVYKIGNYEFETLREYRQAQDDLNKIKYITDELDIYDPEVALQLYTMMREKKIRFKSEIGKSFFWCISDIVADNTQNMIQEKLALEEAEEAEKLPFHFNIRQVIGIVCIAIAMVCLGYYLVSEYNDYRSTKKLQELQNLSGSSVVETEYMDTEEPDTAVEPDSTVSTENLEQEPVQPLVMLEDYAALHEQNPQMVGWLHIADAEIDYPVMQSSVEEPDYYLSHAFDRSDDSNGTLFIDARNNYIDRDDNIIIYGHNMKSGMMFGSLKKYLDEDYMNAHKTIEFNTLYEKSTYEVIAVGLGKVEYQDEDTFRYYNFLNAGSEAEFNDYLNNVSQLAVLGTPIDASYGDELLTLSTCNSYTEDGRMFVLAKKIQ